MCKVLAMLPVLLWAGARKKSSFKHRDHLQQDRLDCRTFLIPVKKKAFLRCPASPWQHVYITANLAMSAPSGVEQGGLHSESTLLEERYRVAAHLA